MIDITNNKPNSEIRNAEIELKLHINENLYNKEFISEELYEKAKDFILRDQEIEEPTLSMY